MDDFSSTEEVVTFCSTHFPIGPNAKGVLFEQLGILELDRVWIRGSGL